MIGTQLQASVRSPPLTPPQLSTGNNHHPCSEEGHSTAPSVPPPVAPAAPLAGWSGRAFLPHDPPSFIRPSSLPIQRDQLEIFARLGDLWSATTAAVCQGRKPRQEGRPIHRVITGSHKGSSGGLQERKQTEERAQSFNVESFTYAERLAFPPGS